MLTLLRTIAEISWGEKVFVSPRYSTSTIGLPSWSTTLNGHDSISFLTVGSSNRRPIKRLCRYEHLLTHMWQMMRNLLDVKNSIFWVHSGLVFRGFTNQTLLVGEGDEWRGGEATLLIGNDFDIATFVVCNAGICCALIRWVGRARMLEFVIRLITVCGVSYQDRYQSHLRKPRQPSWVFLF